MSNPASARRHVVIRTSHETLGLVAAAAAMTFALSFAVHSRHERMAALAASTPDVHEAQAPQQDWAGHLAELPSAAATPVERLTSAAMVVPKSALTLPQPAVKPKASRQCGDAACLAGKAPTGTPKRQVAAAEPKVGEEPPKTLFHQLNPLNHLPDIAVVGRPFTYAGGAVAGWFKRL